MIKKQSRSGSKCESRPQEPIPALSSSHFPLPTVRHAVEIRAGVLSQMISLPMRQ